MTLQEVFCFKEEGLTEKRQIIGRFQASGLIPSFVEKFEKRGLKIPRDIFTISETRSRPQIKPARSGLSEGGATPSGGKPASSDKKIPLRFFVKFQKGGSVDFN